MEDSVLLWSSIFFAICGYTSDMGVQFSFGFNIFNNWGVLQLFQNQNGVMIILKIAYNFTVLEGIFETLFHI